MSLRFLTAGESHGKALVGIIESIPAGLEIHKEWIHQHLKRRKLGFGRGNRQKIETDEVDIISGVRFGKTIGSPISLLIWNRDWENWKETLQIEPGDDALVHKIHSPRPGHADLVGSIKYRHSDLRNVLERSSARETAIRVALGSIARKLLEDLGTKIGSRVTAIGKAQDPHPWISPGDQLNFQADQSLVRCTDPVVTQLMIAEIEGAIAQGTTLGGEFEVFAFGVPVGLGSYVHWDRRIEGKIAQSFLSLNAIRGVEIGSGFNQARSTGFDAHDEILMGSELQSLKFASNFSGGIQGGMTSGQPLIIRAAMKPLSTLMNPLRSVNLKLGIPQSAHIERSDVCAVPAAAVIGESLLAFILAEAVLEKFGGDSLEELKKRVEAWNSIAVIE